LATSHIRGARAWSISKNGPLGAIVGAPSELCIGGELGAGVM
jgi:hypothetical protein